MVPLITFTIVVAAWLIAALFLAGSVFSIAFKNFDIGYAKGLRDGEASPTSKNTKAYYDLGFADGYAEGWQNCRREYGKIGKILADNADLDEIMVIRYDDQLPHRYKRIID